MVINVTGGAITKEERAMYEERGKEKFGNALLGMDICVDGEDVEIRYHFDAVPFERIRRITGYLTGTLDKWNDAKRSEEHDRVKHD